MLILPLPWKAAPLENGRLGVRFQCVAFFSFSRSVYFAGKMSALHAWKVKGEQNYLYFGVG